MSKGPVRVVHVITRMIVGGAQQNTVQTCDLLRRRHGWDVTLLTGPPLGPEGELLSQVRRLGIPHLVVPQLRRPPDPVRDALAFASLARAFRRLRPTLVHTHSSKAGFLGRLAARAARVPLIVHHVRGLPFHPYGPAAANALFVQAERLAGRVTDHFVCVARAMVEGFVRAAVAPRSRFSIIRSGMDVDAYRRAAGRRDQVRARLGFRPDELVIGKIGRLFRLKGHEFLIRAAPLVLSRCPRARFLLVGDGILRRSLEQKARRLGVRDRFTFAGLAPPRQIPELISAMDLVVHASLREGLAQVLVQGLLCEKPVVTYALDGAPEVIVDGVTGRLVPPESVEELAEAIVWLIEHPGAARRMAREGRRRVEGEFDIEKTVARTDRLYRRLLGRRGLPVPG